MTVDLCSTTNIKYNAYICNEGVPEMKEACKTKSTRVDPPCIWTGEILPSSFIQCLGEICHNKRPLKVRYVSSSYLNANDTIYPFACLHVCIHNNTAHPVHSAFTKL